jgi:hypothetical protein
MVPLKIGEKSNEVYPYRELLEGEELLASYIDPLLMRAERQQLLQVRYKMIPDSQFRISTVLEAKMVFSLTQLHHMQIMYVYEKKYILAVFRIRIGSGFGFK